MSAEEYVEGHHEYEAEGESDGAHVGVAAFLGLGDEFLHHNVDHGARGESKEIGEHGDEDRGEQNGEQGADGLNNSAERTHEKRFPAGIAGTAQGHGHDGAFGKVLDGDAERQGYRSGHGHIGVVLHGSGQSHAHGHPLRDIVEGDGEHEFGCPREVGAGAFALIAVDVLMGDNDIEKKEKENAAQESGDGRNEARESFLVGHFYRRDEQRPHRRGHHHPGGKSCEELLQARCEILPHKKYAGCPESCPRQG